MRNTLEKSKVANAQFSSIQIFDVPISLPTNYDYVCFHLFFLMKQGNEITKQHKKHKINYSLLQ